MDRSDSIRGILPVLSSETSAEDRTSTHLEFERRPEASESTESPGKKQEAISCNS